MVFRVRTGPLFFIWSWSWYQVKVGVGLERVKQVRLKLDLDEMYWGGFAGLMVAPSGPSVEHTVRFAV